MRHPIGGPRSRHAYALAALATALLTIAAPALALLQEVPDETWGTNGRVYAIARAGNRVYLGGSFTAVKAPSGELVSRNHLAALDVETGAVDPDWDPGVDGTVNELAVSADGLKIFIGGSFTTIDGVSRRNLAAVDANTGAVDVDWSANTSLPVKALAVSGSRLYVGGSFTSVSGRARKRLAAVDASTGSLTNWKPTVNAVVHALEPSPDRTRIYAGGSFTIASGSPRNFAAAFDAVTGAFDPLWAPEINADPTRCGHGCVLDVASGSGLVYLGVGGVPGNRVMAVDATSGVLVWQRLGDGDVNAVAVLGDRLYAGGHFEQMPAGRFDRKKFIALDAITGDVAEDFGPRVNSKGGVWVVAPAPDGLSLYIGGDFTRVSGLPRYRFAQFSDAAATSGM